MQQQAMEKFEAVVKAAIHQAGPIYEVDGPQALILEAADQLILESALEMGEATVAGICGILLTIHKSGQHPGKTPNPLMNELVDILVAAKANEEMLKKLQADLEKASEDHSAHDTY